jgi:hypothetical protein
MTKRIAGLIPATPLPYETYANNVYLLIEQDQELKAVLRREIGDELPWRIVEKGETQWTGDDLDSLCEYLRDRHGQYVPSDMDFLDSLVHRAIAKLVESGKMKLNVRQQRKAGT